jgi:hypothetical protein
MRREVLQDRVRRSTDTRTTVERVSSYGEEPVILVTCVDHDVVAQADHRNHAEHLAMRPYSFCKDCAKIVGMVEAETRHHADGANSGFCDHELGCGRWAEVTALFGNVVAPRDQWIRLCKTCQDPNGQARANVRNRFHEQIEERRKVYKGLSYKQRARYSGKFVIGSWRAQREEGYVG